MQKATRLKTRSGLDLIVGNEDFEIQHQMSERITVKLTVLKFTVFFDELDNMEYNYNDEPIKSIEYFHRDEITWFKTVNLERNDG